MKIIQISTTEFKIYGLGDDGNIYQVFCERYGEYGERKYWEKIKIESPKE